jgi:cytochrome c biogenesis protein CcmG/thiol:disulfide interchange protein DsbE
LKRPAITLLALLGLLLVAACGTDEAGEAGDAVQAAPPASQTFGIGQPAPDFALKDIDGKEVRLSDQRGKAVVVDFWATWCGPCRAVMPHLQALSEEYDQLEVLAVSLDQNPGAAVPPFAAKHGLTFTMLADPRSPQVAQQWGGIRSIPTSFLVSPDGTVVHRWVGVHGRDAYEKEIRKVLGLDS